MAQSSIFARYFMCGESTKCRTEMRQAKLSERTNRSMPEREVADSSKTHVKVELGRTPRIKKMSRIEDWYDKFPRIRQESIKV